MPRSKLLCALFVTVFEIGPVATARADEAADTAAARMLGVDGVSLADSGDCQQAIEKLKRAEELHHAPTTAGRLGECEIGVGHLVQGTERLQRLLREPLAAGAPAPFVDAMTRARYVLDRALPRIATLRVSVKASPRARFAVTVDGEAMSSALLDNDRPTDPGKHAVEVTAPGFLAAKQDVTLGEGQTSSVAMELLPDPSAPVATPVPPPPAVRESPAAARPPVEAKPSSGPNVASIVAFSLGGLGLAAGIAGGVVVAVDSSDLSKSCPSKTCPSSKQDEISAAKTWATVSTVGFAVAGAGLATGLVFLLTGHHSADAPTEARIRPVVGPLYLGCEGAF
jgi:hypothetical protein